MTIHETRLQPLVAAVAAQAARPTLRDYQQELRADIEAEWSAGHANVLAVLPTGGGKTRTLADIVHDHKGACCVIAHRQELVGQIALALASYGVAHRIIGPPKVVKFVVALQVRELGRHFYDPSARVAVAGVDTLVSGSRAGALSAWAAGVTLWIQDEAHHVIRGNKWGRAAEMFPNAKGLGVTATPARTDGKGLGRHADGVFDAMVQGPTLRGMIALGWLTDYVIYAPEPSIVMDPDAVGSTGDYSRPKLAKASARSGIVGDVVQEYLKVASGKTGVTFTTDVATSEKIALRYKAAGVEAQAVDGNTDDFVRADAVRKLGAGVFQQLVNVDLFGEGFDLPAIFVVSLACPTESIIKFAQQCGRALRPMFAPGMPLDTPEQRRAAIAAGPKPRAIIIDHVGNVLRHAVARPDPLTGELIIDICYREWTLDRRDTRGSSKSDAIALTTCRNPEGGPGGSPCARPYEAFRPRCPYCGFEPVPADRSTPDFVEGDLTLLDPSALTAILDQRDPPLRIPQGVSNVAQMGARKQHRLREEAQARLREVMAWWAGYGALWGLEDRELWRLFYQIFGVDAATAQTLKTREAAELTERVQLDVARFLC